MHNIVYIESDTKLIFEEGDESTRYLNHFMAERISGIRKECITLSDMELTWLNKGETIKDLVKNTKVSAYDGILVTSPSVEELEILRTYKKQGTVVISGDTDPGPDFNYVGPDIEDDIRTLFSFIDEFSYNNICVIAYPCKSRTPAIVRAISSAALERGIPFGKEQVVAYDPEEMENLSHLIEKKAKADDGSRHNAICSEILSRQKADLYIFTSGGTGINVTDKMILRYDKALVNDFRVINLHEESHFPPFRASLQGKISHIKEDYNTIGSLSIRLISDILKGKKDLTGNKVLVPGIVHKGISMDKEAPDDAGSDIYFKNCVDHYLHKYLGSEQAGESIAQVLDLDYRYFLVKFKKKYRTTFNKYLQSIRLERAALLLKGTSDKIIDIYHNLGYTSDATFLRQFKERYGETPLSYRKKL